MQTDVRLFFNFLNDIQPEGCLSRYFWMNAHICIKKYLFWNPADTGGTCAAQGSNKSHTVRGSSAPAQYHHVGHNIDNFHPTQLNTTIGMSWLDTRLVQDIYIWCIHPSTSTLLYPPLGVDMKFYNASSVCICICRNTPNYFKTLKIVFQFKS